MLKEARVAYCKAINLNPDLPEFHNLLAILSEKEGKIEEAQMEYLQALKSKPDYLEARFNLANLLFKRNLLLEAASHYKRLIIINPGFAQAYNNLAVIFYYQKKYNLAQDYVKKAEDSGIQVNPVFKKEILKKLRNK